MSRGCNLIDMIIKVRELCKVLGHWLTIKNTRQWCINYELLLPDIFLMSKLEKKIKFLFKMLWAVNKKTMCKMTKSNFCCLKSSQLLSFHQFVPYYTSD